MKRIKDICAPIIIRYIYDKKTSKNDFASDFYDFSKCFLVQIMILDYLKLLFFI